MKFSFQETINSVIGVVDLPLRITENSEEKAIRVLGVLWFAIWFFPIMFAVIVIVGLLCVPAMIQDA